jgi:hypothetical protein
MAILTLDTNSAATLGTLPAGLTQIDGTGQLGDVPDVDVETHGRQRRRADRGGHESQHPARGDEGMEPRLCRHGRDDRRDGPGGRGRSDRGAVRDPDKLCAHNVHVAHGDRAREGQQRAGRRLADTGRMDCRVSSPTTASSNFAGSIVVATRDAGQASAGSTYGGESYNPVTTVGGSTVAATAAATRILLGWT